MAKTILVNAGAGETRVAIVEDGVLQAFVFEYTIGVGDDRPQGAAGQSCIGNIVVGRVRRVVPATNAAFVDIGFERAGFLAARDAISLLSSERRANATIADCVREGERVLVQITKDPIGDKGAQLSASLSLPGRFLVLKPDSPGISVSRRIGDESERDRLMRSVALATADIGERFGYIVRTAATAATGEELREDAAYLAQLWHGIDAARLHCEPPAMLHQDLTLIERVLRDESDLDAVVIDDAQTFAIACTYRDRTMPQSRVKIENRKASHDLFGAMGVEEEVASLTEPRVKLPSGGWITIETTEAMTAIDVNSGSYGSGTRVEDLGFAVNVEAARVIARQLRLRGIGGLIAIDFVDMENPEHRLALMETLHKATEPDRAPVRILPPSEFGVVEMTRKRLGEPLDRVLSEPLVEGSYVGRRKKAAALACDALRQIERAAAVAPGKPITLQAAPEIVDWLNTYEEDVRAGLSRRGVARVTFQADATRSRDSFAVETGP